MREILFRGKIVCDGDWAYGGITWNSSRKKMLIHSDWEECKVIPETVGQYTGLTDKNGKKIFEGDIVRWKKALYFVRWDSKNASFVFADDIDADHYFITGFNMYITRKFGEVIGNIYDNKELINET